MIPLEIESGAGPRRVNLFSYLDSAREELAHEASYVWIKALRHAHVDGVPFRSRLTYRGDSLWWFAELYLHKDRVVLGLHRAIAAFDAMVEAERPLAVRSMDPHRAWLVRRLAASRRIRFDGRAPEPAGWTQALRLDARAASLDAAARLSRVRMTRAAADTTRIAAFVHKAFWRAETSGGGAEAYIGPVLRELESRAGEIRYVGVGPRTNFRARHWWDALRAASPADAVVPVEAFAPLRALKASRDLWRRRHAIRRALWASADIRSHAVIRGCDCWPAIRGQMAGIALLQFPWSARVMDEAGATLDALQPRVAVTYAEAGGWGRAIALECRRRGIPLAAFQHGFIYRHWLNYRHEADEMAPDAANPADAGFPRPAMTLVFDDDAAGHLLGAGRFPPDTVRVTGSPGLDTLVSAVRALSAERLAAIRREAGARDGDAIVLVATKEREAARILPVFLEAARAMDGVVVAIKPHPAETPDVYTRTVSGIPNARVATAAAPLPELLAVAAAVVTVNSTVAIDALTLGVPSLVIGLPNNLSPFVEAGMMAGANGVEEMRAALGRLLYDQEFRHRMLAAAGAVHGPGDRIGGSAARAAEAVLDLLKESRS